MSLILYNPLEAGVLLLYSWFFKPNKIQRNKFNVQDFIIKCYLIGTLNYLVQIFEAHFQNSLLYGIFMLVCYFILMPIILLIFGYHNNIIYIIAIFLLFHTSIDIIIYICHFETSIICIHNNLLYEFVVNLIIKIWQVLILLIFLGGQMMLKKFLKSQAKKNLNKMVASTVKGYGETKLTKKLAKEVKESK